MKRQIHINFSDFWHPDTLEAKLNNPLYKLLSQRFDLVICDNPDFLLFSSFGANFIRHSGVRIFYTGENVRPIIHSAIGLLALIIQTIHGTLDYPTMPFGIHPRFYKRTIQKPW